MIFEAALPAMSSVNHRAMRNEGFGALDRISDRHSGLIPKFTSARHFSTDISKTSHQ